MLSTEVLGRIVTTATRAPSVQNTQPWRVDAHGQVVDVWPDKARSLRHNDPTAREATISCGALVDHVVVAARREGLDTTVTLLPDSAGGSRVDVSAESAPRRLARVVLSPGEPPTSEELELSVAAVHRRTSRTALDDLAVADDLVQALQAVVAGARAHLVLLPPRSTGRDVVLRQVLRAESLAAEDLVGMAEESAWTAEDDLRADGAPAEEPPVGSDPVGADGTLGSRRLTERYPGPTSSAQHAATLALLTTPGDGEEDWLVAGGALSRLLLAASVHGLTASFATTVLENPTTRHEIVRSLGLVGSPQMLVQLGYGRPGARSHRRPVVV